MVKSLYVMSDTHDDLEAVARAVDFAEAEGREGSRIVHVGDLALRPYTKEALEEVMKTQDAQTFLANMKEHRDGILRGYKEVFDSSKMPFTVIPGNYDGELSHVFGDSNIHNRGVDWNGVRVVGYGGAGDGDGDWIGPPHMNPMVQLGEIQMFNPDELKTLLEENSPGIAVIHNPPKGLCDDMFNGNHVGTPTSTRYILHNSNLKLVFGGHIHEAGPNGNNPNGVNGIAGVGHINGNRITRTTVVNPGNLGRFGILSPQTLEPVREFDYGTFARVDIEEDGTPVRVKQYSVQEDDKTIGKVKEIGDFDLSAA